MSERGALLQQAMEQPFSEEPHLNNADCFAGNGRQSLASLSCKVAFGAAASLAGLILALQAARRTK
jgi:hypothetical protein